MTMKLGAPPGLSTLVMVMSVIGVTAALTDAASRQEQFFLNNKSYTTSLGTDGLNMAATVDGGYYTLRVVPPPVGGACPISRCWVMEAAPQGNQTEDTCGILSYSSEGERTPAGCW